MPPQWRRAALGAEPLSAEDAARAEILDRQAAENAIRDMLDRQAAFRQRAWDEALSRAARYRRASLDALKPQQDPDGMVSGWLDTASPTLVLKGLTRRGKTYAAYAVGNEARRRGTWVDAWRVTDLLRYLRPAELEDGRAARVWEDAAGADLLILDDLGKEKPTEWTVSQMNDLMDARGRNARRTIVTTNLETAELLDAYGDAFVYRLAELATIAPVAGDLLVPDAPF
jgi:DNA replication protein DnaC